MGLAARSLDAHESFGGTWDSQCQHDSSQPAQVSVAVLCCEMGPSLSQLHSQSHWSHMQPAYTANTADLTALQMFTTFRSALHPYGRHSHWIGLFVPGSELGLTPCFPPDLLKQPLSWKMETWWSWIRVCVSHSCCFVIHICLSVPWLFVYSSCKHHFLCFAFHILF